MVGGGGGGGAFNKTHHVTNQLTFNLSSSSSNYLVGLSGGSDTPDLNGSLAGQSTMEIPDMKAKEVIIVVFVLVLWVGAIALFYHQWGKINGLDQTTTQLDYVHANMQVKSPMPRPSAPSFPGAPVAEVTAATLLTSAVPAVTAAGKRQFSKAVKSHHPMGPPKKLLRTSNVMLNSIESLKATGRSGCDDSVLRIAGEDQGAMEINPPTNRVGIVNHTNTDTPVTDETLEARKGRLRLNQLHSPVGSGASGGGGCNGGVIRQKRVATAIPGLRSSLTFEVHSLSPPQSLSCQMPQIFVGGSPTPSCLSHHQKPSAASRRRKLSTSHNDLQELKKGFGDLSSPTVTHHRSRSPFNGGRGNPRPALGNTGKITTFAQSVLALNKLQDSHFGSPSNFGSMGFRGSKRQLLMTDNYYFDDFRLNMRPLPVGLGAFHSRKSENNTPTEL